MINLTATWFRTLGDEVRDLFVAHVRKQGKDYKGDALKKYSKGYEEKKARGEFKRQSSMSTTPNLTLTGDMLDDYQVRKYNKSLVQLGWIGSEAAKVSGNAKRGRRIYGDDKHPFPPTIMKYIYKEFDKEATRQLKKFAKGTIEIKMNI
jgi:hypothetical protein